MKTCILVLLMICSAGLKAQQWFETGKSYVYSCRSSTDPEKTIVLTVVYDAAGTATVSRSERKYEADDRRQMYILGPENEVHPTAAGGPTLELNFDGKQDYWFIVFDSYLAGKQNVSKMSTVGGGVLILKSSGLILH